LFGALAGIAGASISAIDRNFYGAIAKILLAVYLALTVLRTRQAEKKCHVPRIAAVTRSGLLLGMLTGINFCPAFLIALTESVNLGGAVSGIMLFMGFFTGTTLYLIPLAFAGLLTQVKKMKEIARILSIIVAIWFIFKGVSSLVDHYEQPEPEATRIIDVYHPARSVIVISDLNNIQYFMELRNSLMTVKNQEVEIFSELEAIPESLLTPQTVIFLDAGLKPDEILKKLDIISVEPGYDVESITGWLQKFTFQTAEPLFWEFKVK
jgi:hypothetical protein